MDKLDWKILELLDWHGRIPMNKLAQRVGSNKDVVAYRVKKLEQENVIIRYYPLLNMQKLGYHTSRIMFDLEELHPENEKDFVVFLDKEINAGLIFRMDYPYRYGILLWTKSIYDVEQSIVKIKRKLGAAFIRYTYSLFCTYKLYPKDYLFGKKFHEKSVAFAPQIAVKYDTNDYRILKELANDARLSTVQISQNLRTPQTTVSHKIKQLEKSGIILGYRAEINFIKLGYTNYFLEIYLDDNNNLSQIESWANTNKNVMWLQKVIGTCDIEIEVEVKDRVELETLLNELRNKFKNIRKIIFFSQEYKKFTFLP